MNRTTRTVLSLVALTTFVATAATATADTGIYDWPDDQIPTVVTSDHGLVMINQSGEPVRAFDWRGNDGEHDRPLRLIDMDGDGSPNVIGSGHPTFVTDSAGVPVFSFEDGCDQVVVADIIRDSENDLLCVSGADVGLYTHTGSRAWSVDLGRNIDYCHAGDLTGDTNPDVECKYRGSDQFIRFRPQGEVITQDASEPGVTNPVDVADQFHPVDESTWTGERTFDLDGDGNASETIHADADTIEIHKEGQDEPLATIETSGDVEAATVTELEEKESTYIVAATSDRIYVIGEAGDDVSDHSANPSDYNRVPHADFDAINVNGFEDNDAVREMVRDIQDDIANCYGNRIRQAPFAGTGRYILQLFVQEDGSIQNANPRHSDVDDDQIESCTEDAITSIDYPGADGPRGIVNVNVVFSFVDE